MVTGFYPESDSRVESPFEIHCTLHSVQTCTYDENKYNEKSGIWSVILSVTITACLSAR